MTRHFWPSARLHTADPRLDVASFPTGFTCCAARAVGMRVPAEDDDSVHMKRGMILDGSHRSAIAGTALIDNESSPRGISIIQRCESKASAASMATY